MNKPSVYIRDEADLIQRAATSATSIRAIRQYIEWLKANYDLVELMLGIAAVAIFNSYHLYWMIAA